MWYTILSWQLDLHWPIIYLLEESQLMEDDSKNYGAVQESLQYNKTMQTD